MTAKSIKIACDAEHYDYIDLTVIKALGSGVIVSIREEGVGGDDDIETSVMLNYPKLEELHWWIGEVLKAERERRNGPENKAKWRQVMNDAGANLPEPTDSDGEVE